MSRCFRAEQYFQTVLYFNVTPISYNRKTARPQLKEILNKRLLETMSK